MRYRLDNLKVHKVHLVDSPANRRPFALIKSLLRIDPEDDVKDSLKKFLATLFKKDDAAIDELAKKLDAGDDDARKEVLTALGGSEEVAKMLGLTPPTNKPVVTPAPTTKSTDDKSEARVLALESNLATLTKAIESLVTHQTTVQKAALTKRAEKLVAAGFEVDVEKATEVEVTALEKALAQRDRMFQDLGITKAFGTPDNQGENADSLTAVIHSETRKAMGGREGSPLEKSRAMQAVFKAEPGLLSDAVAEERTRNVLRHGFLN